MISFLKGKVISNNNAEVVILTSGGVGYKVAIKPNVVDKFIIGDEVEIPTYLAVGENMLSLYGFANEEERELFTYFLNVSGIGPKSALHLLSLGAVEETRNAISTGDIDYLTKVSGVGRKTAERIIVELKSKIGETTINKQAQGENLGDVIDGLVAMGYSVQQARETAKGLDTSGKSSEQLLREALQSIK